MRPSAGGRAGRAVWGELTVSQAERGSLVLGIGTSLTLAGEQEHCRDLTRGSGNSD